MMMNTFHGKFCTLRPLLGQLKVPKRLMFKAEDNVFLHLLWGWDRPAYRLAVAWKITELGKPIAEVCRRYTARDLAERQGTSRLPTPAILAQPWYKQFGCDL